MNKTLGVLGGMGAQATSCFYEILHSMQRVSAEQEYLDILIYSKPTIPDRTAFITGRSDESPLDSMVSALKVLENAGVSCVAIPCVTSHYFYDEFSKTVNIPILHMPEETAHFLVDGGISKIGLLATDGTLKGRVFHSAFEKSGIELIELSADSQARLMEIIYDIKRGGTAGPEILDTLAAELRGYGAEALVLGCTELCVIARDCPDYINAMEVLARAALGFCLS